MNTESMSGPSFGAVSRWIVAAVVGFGLTVAQAAPVSGQGTWETTLQGRDINGNPVPLLAGGNPNPAAVFFYDTQLDLTWLANWNLNGTKMTWDDAMTWAAALNINGYTGWVLPGVLDINNDGCDFGNWKTDCGYNVYDVYDGEVLLKGSPLAHVWYATLANLAANDTTGSGRPGTEGVDWGLVNTGPFRNLISDKYWSGETYGTGQARAWNFYTTDGLQDSEAKDAEFYAVAIRRGDLQPRVVSEPDSLAVLLAGMLTFALVRRGRRR